MDDDDDAQARVGSVIAGKYLLERLLGAGGMGAVYAARHEFTGRQVAVKLMHPALTRSKMASERFIREARAPSSIGHPGIVEVLDGGRDEDGTLYLVLELLKGAPLSALLGDGEVSQARVIEITLELLDALSAAHAAGFTHRDIKPDNVFIARDPDGTERVKLLDFGVAGTLTDSSEGGLTQTGAVLGTPRYMSPEQATGKKADERSDVYSVGALLYHLMSGQPVHRGGSYHEVIVSIVTGEHVPLDTLCPTARPALRAVVERALRKNPTERYASARELAAALRRAAGAEGDVDIDVEPHSHERPAIARRAAARAEATRQAGNATAARPAPASRASRPEPSRVGRGAHGWVVGAAVLLLLSAGLLAAALSTRSTDEEDASDDASATPAVAPPSTPDEPVAPQAAQLDASPNAPAVEAPAAPTKPAEPEATQPAAATEQVAGPAQPLTHEQITQVMTSHEAEIQRCFQDALGKALTDGTPLPAGNVRLDVSMLVRISGQTGSVRVEGTTLAGVTDCVQESVRGWRFPPAAVETPVSFPLVFQPTVLGR